MIQFRGYLVKRAAIQHPLLREILNEDGCYILVDVHQIAFLLNKLPVGVV